jgi:two-component system CheB/CheR fusion protein
MRLLEERLKEQRGDQNDRQPHDLTLVAVLASSSAEQALRDFFQVIPPTTGAAFAVVAHLLPEHRRSLAQALDESTAMPVQRVRLRTPLEGDHVYSLSGGGAVISERCIGPVASEQAHGGRNSFDYFLRSLAAWEGDVFVVVLSGSGSDGSAGLKAIQENGGAILVQDPGEAENPSMPLAALATRTADAVLPVRELAHLLSDYLERRENASAPPRPFE